MFTDSILQILVGLLIGSVAGYLGAFMVLRRMSLVGDALSHVALPGIAVAIILGFNVFFGAFAALFIAVIGIWFLERRTELPSETLVGIFFTLSLALGLLLTPEPELLEALFGDIAKIGPSDGWITLIASAFVFIATRKITRNLTLGIISKELAKAVGVNINKINLIFLLMVAVVVALGLKVAGTLLMGSLVIIPAAAAKNISISLKHYGLTSTVFGAVSAVIGIIVASKLGLNPGPIVVLTSGILFLVTLFFKKTNGLPL